MRIMEERVQVISHDSILGRSMYNVNKQAHNELAAQMKEWESKKGNKVYIAKMGETANYSALSRESIARGAKAGAEKNKHKSVLKGGSTRQNLCKRASDRIEVKIGTFYVGAFTNEQDAIEARDKYRAKNGLPPATY